MKIQWSGLGITDGRGKIGGNVLSRNASGAYARKNTAGTNPNTPLQQFVRAIFATISTGWRNMTQGQRDAWNLVKDEWPQVNSLGQTFTLTGQQLYMKLNNSLMQVGLPAIVIAPSKTTTYSPSELTVANSNAAQTLVATINDPINAGVVPAEVTPAIYVTPPVSQGQNQLDGKFEFLDLLAPGAGPVLDISAAYTAKYGVIPVNSKIGVEFVGVTTATGERGVPVSNSGIAV